ncbi:hypothetical protein Tco_0808728 [Tanacetum coccineum]
MDNIQAMIKADEQLAARVQAEEQELYSIKEKSRLLVEMIAERKRFFAAQRATEQRSKPPTKSLMRNRMCTYLRNMGDDKDKDSEKKAGGSRKKTLARKRVGEKQSEESARRQKIEDDAEKEELRAHLDIISRDDVADVLDLYRLVKERFETASLEGYDRLLWGDLITIFEPSKDDERRHILLLKRCFQECRNLEVDNESEMAFELLRFTRS